MPHSTSPIPADDIPAFPEHLPQAPIQRISLSALLDRNADAEQDLWTACSTHGFFYLDLTTCDEGKRLAQEADALEALSHPAFRVPMEQKQEAAMVRWRGLFGYKGAGCVAQADQFKRADKGEFWNVSKDDMLGQSEQPIPYPPMIQEAKGTFVDFITTAHGIGMLVLGLLANRLDIDPEVLKGKHRVTEQSGDHVRLTYGPGDPDAADGDSASPKNEKDVAITTFAHTDFGSVTLLFNWLGGLQIENRDKNCWEWVKPIPGHAICNLGDAMVDFAGGRVSSGKHRVVAAPGLQGKLERYSIVYFVRPEDEVILEDLTPGAPVKDGQKWKAGAWIKHRASQLGNTVKKD